jgi:hypothetical protein
VSFLNLALFLLGCVVFTALMAAGGSGWRGGWAAFKFFGGWMGGLLMAGGLVALISGI